MPGVQIDAKELRALDLELRAANKALKNKMRRNLRAATLPARQAVQAEERAVLPKRGGLNEWVASAEVKHRMTTPASGAVVKITQGRNSGSQAQGAPQSVAQARIFASYGPSRLSRSNLRLANQQGLIRHPNRGGPRWSIDRRDEAGGWSSTPVLAGFFDKPLLAMAPQVTAAMVAVMDETARVAGFHGR